MFRYNVPFLSFPIGNIFNRIISNEYGIDKHCSGLLRHLLWDVTMPTLEQLLSERFERGDDRTYLFSKLGPTCSDFSIVGNLIVLV